MDKNKLVGETLKKLRKKKMMTLQQLAQETGISAGYISKIERGSANPSADNIQKLSYALEVTANELMIVRPEAEKKRNGHAQQSYVMKKGDHAPIYGITNTLTFASIFEEMPQFKVNVLTLLAGMKEESFSIHAYDEFGIITSGILRITLDDEHLYELVEGDCILIRANTKHAIINPSQEDCVSYWIEICET